MVGRQVRVTVERPHERVVLIRASGVLDRGAAAALLRLIDAQAELVRHGRRTLDAVLLDLHGVTTVDAAACPTLRRARPAARRGGFDLCLTGCGGRLRRLPLAVPLRLTEHRTFPSVEAAVAAHTRRAPVGGRAAVVFPEPRKPVEQETRVLA